jgi:hypothetical protein
MSDELNYAQKFVKTLYKLDKINDNLHLPKPTQELAEIIAPKNMREATQQNNNFTKNQILKEIEKESLEAILPEIHEVSEENIQHTLEQAYSTLTDSYVTINQRVSKLLDLKKQGKEYSSAYKQELNYLHEDIEFVKDYTGILQNVLGMTHINKQGNIEIIVNAGSLVTNNVTLGGTMERQHQTDWHERGHKDIPIGQPNEEGLLRSMLGQQFTTYKQVEQAVKSFRDNRLAKMTYSNEGCATA